MLIAHAALLDGCDWYMSEDPAVPTLAPATLFVAVCEADALAGPENPRKDSGGGTCPPVLLRFLP